jgi:dTDP-4-amino-4,6-dideoxygalactose transaminase
MKTKVNRYLGLYPQTVNKEVSTIKKVLGSTNWNTSYSKLGLHTELERKIANYVGTEYAVAVGSGGVGIQMLMRSLGMNSDHEVIIQADTCAAVPQALLNAQCIPKLVDSNIHNFQIDESSLAAQINNRTKIVLATHMWGNPEDLEMIHRVTSSKNIEIIEDACLALGSKVNNTMLGSDSLAGVYSFGSTKPVQAGEGGIIVTNNESLARELRSLRNWGDRETEFGTRDVVSLSWNGRMSEITAAVILEQLKGYPTRLETIQNYVCKFKEYARNNKVFSFVNNENDLAFTQLSLLISQDSKLTKMELLEYFQKEGIPTFHANFEPLTELTLFNSGDWKKWINSVESIDDMKKDDYPGAYKIYNTIGIGLQRSNFASKRNFTKLIKAVEKIIS